MYFSHRYISEGTFSRTSTVAFVFFKIKQKEKFVRSISEVKLPENFKGKTQNCLHLVL